MAKSQPKIALSEPRGIPFDKLVLSQSNVRRVKAGVAIEELAEDRSGRYHRTGAGLARAVHRSRGGVGGRGADHPARRA